MRCAWSPDGSKVSAGSADRFVYIWDANTRRILYKLPGHNGSVNDVDFHPKEPISKYLSKLLNTLYCYNTITVIIKTVYRCVLWYSCVPPLLVTVPLLKQFIAKCYL